MIKFLLLLLCFQVIISISFSELYNRTKGAISTAADFIPIVSNVKGVAEVVTGKDYITGKNLTKTERAFSLLGAIPFGGFLKNAKHLKNGKKFFEAAKRAKNIGKAKNYVKFAKASARAMKKASAVQNIVKGATKLTNGLFKQFGMTSDNNNTSENTDM